MAQTTTALMTVEEFERLPDGNVRRELVRGEVIEMTPGGYDHSTVGARIIGALIQAAGHLGEVVSADCGFILADDPSTVRMPDAGFVRRGRVPDATGRELLFRGAPDLAVEVVSPSDTMAELLQKVGEYLEAGTSLVWVVVPSRREVYVYRPVGAPEVIGDDGVLTGDPVLPGLSIGVADLFARQASS